MIRWHSRRQPLSDLESRRWPACYCPATSRGGGAAGEALPVLPRAAGQCRLRVNHTGPLSWGTGGIMVNLPSCAPSQFTYESRATEIKGRGGSPQLACSYLFPGTAFFFLNINSLVVHSHCPCLALIYP